QRAVHALQRFVEVRQPFGSEVALGAPALIRHGVTVVADHAALARARPDGVDGHVAGDDRSPASRRTIAAELSAVECGEYVDQRTLSEFFVLGISTTHESTHARIDRRTNGF